MCRRGLCSHDKSYLDVSCFPVSVSGPVGCYLSNVHQDDEHKMRVSASTTLSGIVPQTFIITIKRTIQISSKLSAIHP